MKRYHIIVKGNVQGVFFRHHTKQKALELEIKGFVRNLPSSDVEIFAEGGEPQMRAFIGWCREGPKSAHVIDLRKNEVEFSEGFSGFEIRY